MNNPRYNELTQDIQTLTGALQGYLDRIVEDTSHADRKFYEGIKEIQLYEPSMKYYTQNFKDDLAEIKRANKEDKSKWFAPPQYKLSKDTTAHREGSASNNYHAILAIPRVIDDLLASYQESEGIDNPKYNKLTQDIQTLTGALRGYLDRIIEDVCHIGYDLTEQLFPRLEPNEEFIQLYTEDLEKKLAQKKKFLE
jgi:hypothetical protein